MEIDNNLAPALVLHGAGARTAYQAGVIKALGEIFPQDISPFPIICGTSAGSINGAYLSSRANEWKNATEVLTDFWSNIRPEQVFETSGLVLSRISSAWISRVVLPGFVRGHENSNYMLDTSPLSKLISKGIDFQAIRKNIERGSLKAISFSCIEYFEETTVIFFDAHPSVQEWTSAGRRGVRCELEKKHLMASTAIPIFFPPIRIGDSYYGDGSLRQISPLSPAIHLGADRIISIGIRQEKKRSKNVPADVKRQSPAFAEILGELLNALFLDSLDPDIERLRRINDAIKNQFQEDSVKKRNTLRVIPILHLTPSRNLGEIVPPITKSFPLILRYLIRGLGVSDSDTQGLELISYFSFTKEFVTPLVSLGYEDTMKKKEMILEFMGQKI